MDSRLSAQQDGRSAGLLGGRGNDTPLYELSNGMLESGSVIFGASTDCG
jgi:hypothetical protein